MGCSSPAAMSPRAAPIAADWSGLNRNGISNYELGPVLGSGMFSTVREGKHKVTGIKVAIKIIKNLGSDESTINQEIRAMKLVKGHPHVVNLFEVCTCVRVLGC